MNSTLEHDVTEFRSWLKQSIRRAWILAFAVAIPGAFLLTWWFPYSPVALLEFALLGIAIGVIADRVEAAKKRRLEGVSRIIAVRQAVQDLISLIEEQTNGGNGSPPDDARSPVQHAGGKPSFDRAEATHRLTVAQLRLIHRALDEINEKLGKIPSPWKSSTPAEFLETIREFRN